MGTKRLKTSHVLRRGAGVAASPGIVAFGLFLCCLTGGAQTTKPSSTADFFVAVDGNDSWSGRLARANPQRTDGPFASLTRARDAVRGLSHAGSRRDVLVQVRAGVYRLTETIVFSLADSAPEKCSIVYGAYPGEAPILSSGMPIRGWRRLAEPPAELPSAARGKVWVADLPAELRGCLTLFDGMERLPRARGEGFAPPDRAGYQPSPDKLLFPPGALRAWPDLKSGELRVIPTADYEMSLLPLASVDEGTGIATTTVPASRPIGKVKFFPVSAWVENVLAVLDQPGEWVFRPDERRLYLWPRGEVPGDDIVAPALTELVRVEGAIDYEGPKDALVQGLTFRGLTFAHTERLPWYGQTGWSLQHHWEMFDRPTAAVRLRGAEGCVVEACRFTSLGGAAIRLDLSCQHNRVADNEIGHVGGVGVLLAGYGPGTKDVNRQNEVSNNWIHHTGETYWAAPAVMIWQSGENRVANNLIHNTPYSGITVSTRSAWNPANTTSDGSRSVRWSEIGNARTNLDWYSRALFLHARRNLVEANEIHDMMEAMGDGDGIYISGTGERNLIRRNYIHDCDSDHMADGIRCDDDQHETIMEGNVICRVRRIGQGICSKGKNDMLNNFLVDLRPSRLPIRPERVVRGYIGLIVNPVTGSRIERNVLVSRLNDCSVYSQDRRYGRGGEPRLRECQADYNLYYCAGDPQWGLKHLEREQALGVEIHSLAADPLFVDLDRGDFRFKPESPAGRLGIQPVDFSAFGLRAGHPYYKPQSSPRTGRAASPKNVAS